MYQSIVDFLSAIPIVKLAAICTILVTVGTFLWPRIRDVFARRAHLPRVAMILALLILAAAVVLLTDQVVSTVQSVLVLRDAVHATAKQVTVQDAEIQKLNARFSDLTNSTLQNFRTWFQGKAEVRLIRTSEGICYLTYVRGRFEGDGNAVFIVERDGYWYLGGHSRQSGVAAQAKCWVFPSALQGD